MEPVPTALINPIRMVVAFTLDVGPADVHPPAVRFSVVKRTGIASYTLRERLFQEKVSSDGSVIRTVAHTHDRTPTCKAHERRGASASISASQMPTATTVQSTSRQASRSSLHVFQQKMEAVCSWKASRGRQWRALKAHLIAAAASRAIHSFET